MNNLQEIESMISATLKNEMELLQMRCYVLRRVVGMTPMQTAKHLGITPNAVNSYAQRAAIIFSLNDIEHEDNTYNVLLRQCQDCLRRSQLKQHRNHAVQVVERMNRKLKQTA